MCGRFVILDYGLFGFVWFELGKGAHGCLG